MDRDDSLALLRSVHSFPGPFEFRVVVHPPQAPSVLSAMTAAAGPASKVVHVDERRSAQGKYLALHVQIHLENAEDVLEVYGVLKQVEGVLLTM